MAVDHQLAVLTRAGAGFGIRFLGSMATEGITPGLLVVEKTPFARRWSMAKYLARHIGWVDSLRYNIGFWWPLLLRRVSRGYLYKIPDYDHYTDRLLVTTDINGPEVVSALSEFGIRRVILAQSGIIRKAILDLPGLWIVNCHPGLLPAYRGVDVIKWALLNRAPLGVTLHLVDAGIDTGSILETRCIALHQDDTPESVESRMITTSLELLLEACRRSPDSYKPLPKRSGSGHQYYLMSFKDRARLQQKWPDILRYYLSERRHAEKLLR